MPSEKPKIRHAGKFYNEGWSWECRCGAGDVERTKAEAVEAYRRHKERRLT